MNRNTKIMRKTPRTKEYRKILSEKRKKGGQCEE